MLNLFEKKKGSMQRIRKYVYFCEKMSIMVMGDTNYSKSPGLEVLGIVVLVVVVMVVVVRDVAGYQKA